MAGIGKGAENITASFIASSDSVYDFFCEPCAGDDKNEEANGFCVECQDYLCNDCIKAHGKNKASKKHAIHSQTQMPRRKPSAPLLKLTTQSCTEKCDLHPEKTVEYYCKDDESLACTVCLVKHRQCKAVDHISNLSEHLLDSQEYQQFQTSLANLKIQTKDVIKNANDKTIQAQKLYTDFETDLQELRRQVIEAYDELAADLKHNADSIKTADIKKLTDICVKGTYILDEVETICTHIQALQNKNQQGQLFVSVVKFRNKIHTLQRQLDQAAANNCITGYIFKPETKIQQILGDPSSVGNLLVQASASMTPAHPNNPKPPKVSPRRRIVEVSSAIHVLSSAHQSDIQASDIKAVPIHDIDVSTSTDTKRCRITGFAAIPDNKMILVDYDNRKIKLLQLQTRKITSELMTTSAPWAVAIIKEDQVAVTLHKARKLVFVNVTNGLKIDKELRVNGECQAFVHNNGNLIVSFSDPLKIEIMMLDGKVIRRIDCVNLFHFPSHMTLNLGHDSIYLSDDERHCVKKLSFSGIVEAEYSDRLLRSPRGAVVDQLGRVLVCGEGSGNIHLLTSDLAKIKVLVNDVQWPCGLSLCITTNTLYSRHSGSVRVYQLS